MHDMAYFTIITAGVYTLDIFAKAEGAGDNLPQIFTYVINVAKGNLSWQPYPKCYGKWGTGCSCDLTDGQLDEAVERDVQVRVPGAQDVAVITADDKWTHLTKVRPYEYEYVNPWLRVFKLSWHRLEYNIKGVKFNAFIPYAAHISRMRRFCFCQGKDDTFSGKVNTGPPGKMQVFSQAKGEENFAALLEYDVRVFFFKQITCIDTIISSSRNINLPKAFSCCSKKPDCNFLD